MSQLKRNIIANFAGRTWTNLLGFLFIPLYLRFLGVESYGLIGFFATLQGIFGLLDLGIGATLNREMARLSAVEGKAQEQRDLLRTLEAIYWAIAVIMAIGVVAVAPMIARHWINPKELSRETVEGTLRLMGILLAVQFPFSFYQGGLMGLQRQVGVNVLVAAIGTIRAGGAVLVLWLISPTVEAFFAWQILAVGAGAGTCLLLLWKTLPITGAQPRVRRRLLGQVWRFAAGVSGNAIAGVLLTQLDKIILIRALSLEDFGYYALAWQIASVLWSLAIPINAAIFPRFTQLHELGDEAHLADLYHAVCQFSAVVLLPIGITLVMFSREVMVLWTHNALTADKTSLLVSILVAGATINGLASVAGYLQLACGWPQLYMYTNFISVVLLVPAIVIMTAHFGPVGAAMVWLGINAMFLVFTVPLMHRRLLRGQMWTWYWQDVGIPVVGLLTIGLIGRWSLPSAASFSGMVMALVMLWLSMCVAAIFLTPRIRAWILAQLRPVCCPA